MHGSMLDWGKPRKHPLSERSQADKVTHGMMDLWGDIQNGPTEKEYWKELFQEKVFITVLKYF